MQAFDLAQLSAEQATAGRAYREFLRVPALSLGLYALPAGGVDPQQPHSEDEVYYVAAGSAKVTVGAEQHTVGPGSIVYVAAHVPHHFHDITADLRLLVFFAPPEYSQAEAAAQ